MAQPERPTPFDRELKYASRMDRQSYTEIYAKETLEAIVLGIIYWVPVAPHLEPIQQLGLGVLSMGLTAGTGVLEKLSTFDVAMLTAQIDKKEKQKILIQENPEATDKTVARAIFSNEETKLQFARFILAALSPFYGLTSSIRSYNNHQENKAIMQRLDDES